MVVLDRKKSAEAVDSNGDTLEEELRVCEQDSGPSAN